MLEANSYSFLKFHHADPLSRRHLQLLLLRKTIRMEIKELFQHSERKSDDFVFDVNSKHPVRERRSFEIHHCTYLVHCELRLGSI